MPKCKNDPKKSYKGDEPSPKGLGYCAHAEKVGVTKNSAISTRITFNAVRTPTVRAVVSLLRRNSREIDQTKM